MIGAAGRAGDVDAAAHRLVTDAPFQIPGHAAHVDNRAFAIASTEHDRIAILQQVADGHQFLFGVDADQIAHGVIGGVGPGHGAGGENHPGALAEVSGQFRADIFHQHVQGRTAIDFNQDVLLHLGGDARLGERRAALAEAGGHFDHRRRKGGAAQTGAAEVGAVGRALANRQAADQKAATIARQLLNRVHGVLAARVGVDQNQRHDGLGQPGTMRRLEIGAGGRAAGEQTVAGRR